MGSQSCDGVLEIMSNRWSKFWDLIASDNQQSFAITRKRYYSIYEGKLYVILISGVRLAGQAKDNVTRLERHGAKGWLNGCAMLDLNLRIFIK